MSSTGSSAIARGPASSTSTASARRSGTASPRAPRIGCSMPFASTFRRAWRRRSPLATLAIAVGVVIVAAAAGAAAQSRFRAGTDLVALQVTVTDPQRKSVPDLRQEDFAIFEEGRQMSIDLFAAGSVPLDLMLVIDTSRSMFERMPTVRQAASNFVRALADDDRAEVIFFNHRVNIAQSLTADRGALIAAIQRAHASGSTALYEALYIALKRLASDPERDQTPRRQAVVVLTDGDDTTSHVTFDAVYAQARGNDAAVYGIIPPSTISRDAYRYPQPESLFDLRLLADETGGRVFTPARTPD